MNDLLLPEKLTHRTDGAPGEQDHYRRFLMGQLRAQRGEAMSSETPSESGSASPSSALAGTCSHTHGHDPEPQGLQLGLSELLLLLCVPPLADPPEG